MSAFNPLAVYLGLVKIAKTSTPEAYRFNTLSFVPLCNDVAISDGVANTTVQASFVLPQIAKIAKVAVSCSALNALTGHSFNVVVGSGSYTQGVIAPGDDSLTFGYPNTFASAGDALFSADVVFDAANFPGIATASGGSSVFVPSEYDACYAAGQVLTLRCTTPASTGSITNLSVTLLLEPIDPQPNITEAVPLTDW